MSESPAAVSATAILKTYGPTVALDRANLEIRAGSVHALLGENGAGKSTLVKILSGLVQPDSGRLSICGAEVAISSPRAALSLGIQTAFQEMTQIADLTVTQNMMLLREPIGPFGQIRRREAERVVSAHLTRLGLGSISPRAEVRDLDLAVRQKLEIARALFRKPRILLLDEPTSSLTGPDIAWLGQIIAEAKASGISVIFISHRMPEVQEFCEYLTVFRNGKDIGTGRVDEISEEEVVRMIIGRSLSAAFPPKHDASDRNATPVLEARAISVGDKLKGASFKLAPGEILGVAGLQGMGQLDLLLACFGAAELSEGEIAVRGRPVTLASPRDAIAADIGIGFVPEDRKTEGLFLKLSGRQNVSLPVVGRFARFGMIDSGKENRAVADVMDAVQVDRRALYTRAGAFSGGNQQKIAIAKWLLTGSRILLLYDPTRGVDVGTKHEIYVLIRNFAREGGSVLIFSTEIPELVGLCDRVLVMYGGRITQEIEGEAVSEEAIMHAALGAAGPMREGMQKR